MPPSKVLALGFLGKYIFYPVSSLQTAQLHTLQREQAELMTASPEQLAVGDTALWHAKIARTQALISGQIAANECLRYFPDRSHSRNDARFQRILRGTFE